MLAPVGTFFGQGILRASQYGSGNDENVMMHRQIVAMTQPMSIHGLRR